IILDDFMYVYDPQYGFRGEKPPNANFICTTNTPKPLTGAAVVTALQKGCLKALDDFARDFWGCPGTPGRLDGLVGNIPVTRGYPAAQNVSATAKAILGDNGYRPYKK